MGRKDENNRQCKRAALGCGKLDAFVVKVAKESENTDIVNGMLLSSAICQGA